MIITKGASSDHRRLLYVCVEKEIDGARNVGDAGVLFLLFYSKSCTYYLSPLSQINEFRL
jgi:hypothetical protein